MPGNTFIQFLEIEEGESVQEGHLGAKGKGGWIEITDWSWDIEAETSFLKGGGSSVGKPTPGNLSITHNYDLSSPAIMNRIVAGTNFTKVVIDQLKQVNDDKGKPKVFFQIVMASVFITKVSTKGGEDGNVTQDVEMVFKEVSVGYKAQKNEDGSLESAQKTFNWNIAQMNESVSMSANVV